MKKKTSKWILRTIIADIYEQNELFDWDKYIDSINKSIHYLAYNKQNKIIKQITLNIFKVQLWNLNAENDTLVHIAAKTNNFDLFKYAINVDINIIYNKNKLGMTPLFYFLHNYVIVKKIINTHILKDHDISHNCTLFEHYIKSKNIQMISYLAHTLIFNKNSTVLFTLIESLIDVRIKIKILRILIRRGIDINLLNDKFISLLIISIASKQYDITFFLLKNGAEINYYGPENLENPLTIAIHNNDIPMIKLLLDNGININIQDKYLCTPMHYIFLVENKIPTNIRRKLLDNVSNVNVCDKYMNSILNLLTYIDDWTKYEDILENKKLDINLKNKNNISPINNIPSTQIDQFYEMVYRSYIKQLVPNIEWADKKDNEIATAMSKKYDIEKYKKYIYNKIIAGYSYPKKKSKTKIFFPIPPITNITYFSSMTHNYICYLAYLLNKYANIKIPSLTSEQKNIKSINDIKKNNKDIEINKFFKSILRDYINHSPVLINHIIIWKDPGTVFISPYLIDGINDTIQKFPDIKFILIKLTIITKIIVNHANIIIYDVPNNYIERFDPYGKVPYYNNKKIDDILEFFFKKKIPNIKYISSYKLINNISYQVFSDEKNADNHFINDPSGFCLAWCVWYVELRINNPDINIKTLTKKSIYYINKKENNVKDYIRNYSDYLDKKKNKILKCGGLNKKFWYTVNIPFNIYRHYMKYINFLYKKIMEPQNND